MSIRRSRSNAFSEQYDATTQSSSISSQGTCLTPKTPIRSGSLISPSGYSYLTNTQDTGVSVNYVDENTTANPSQQSSITVKDASTEPFPVVPVGREALKEWHRLLAPTYQSPQHDAAAKRDRAPKRRAGDDDSQDYGVSNNAAGMGQVNLTGQKRYKDDSFTPSHQRLEFNSADRNPTYLKDVEMGGV